MAATEGAARPNFGPGEIDQAITAYDVMCEAIAANAFRHTESLTRQAQEAKQRGETPTPIPPQFESQYSTHESSFAHLLVATAINQVDRANAYAAETGGPRVKRLIIWSDIDGTLVPWGYETRWDLRGGFIPGVRMSQARLAKQNIEVKVAVASDRPQKILTPEAKLLLAGLARDRTLLVKRILSARDGRLVRSMAPELRTQQYKEVTADRQQVRAARIAAVADIMTATAVDADAYHEKVPMLRHFVCGPGARPGDAHVALDDLSYPDHLDHPLIRGILIVRGNPAEGGMQPLTPDDSLIYGYR
jgi:hypothetical protein